jgi:hypothetical protein
MFVSLSLDFLVCKMGILTGPSHNQNAVMTKSRYINYLIKWVLDKQGHPSPSLPYLPSVGCFYDLAGVTSVQCTWNAGTEHQVFSGQYSLGSYLALFVPLVLARALREA